MLRRVKSSKFAIFHVVLLLGLLYTAISLTNSKHFVRINLQHSVFDEFNRIHPREPTHQVVIIDIDESSLEAVGQWPWPRNVMANLTKSLKDKGATAIAFDGVFPEEDQSSPHKTYAGLSLDQISSLPDAVQKNGQLYNYDELFAQEIKKSKIFVTAFTYGRVGREQRIPTDKKRIMARSDVKNVFLSKASSFTAAAANLPILSKAAAGSGSFMAKPDGDGVLRRTGMIFSNGENIYPSLSLEVIRVALLGRKGVVRLADVPLDGSREIDTNYRILVGDKEIPVDDDGILYVYYRHFCTQGDVLNVHESCSKADYIPAYKFLKEEYDQETRAAIEGKIVLIGASAEGLRDLRNTALEPFRPGVEIHANVIEQVLSGKYLMRPSVTYVFESAYILFAGLFFILLSPFIGVLFSVILCFSIMAFAVFGAYFVYVEHGLLFDPVYSSLAVLIIFIVSTIMSYARAEAKRKQIRNAFGMYVAGDVMRDLEKDPEKLKLGGENRDITVMFTDVRNFTTISENMSPEELIQLMNDFLTEMSDIVMTHQGTVDKYIGDAMMSFWNAPRDVIDHERQACISALKMHDAFAPINERLLLQAEKEGREQAHVLRAGIGINTGLCAVGNMGSRQRFAYSALGDAVNLASRLEGQSKLYGIDVIIGEAVYDKVTDFAAIELDVIRVVGRAEPVCIYGLFGDQELASQGDFKNWKEAHTEMLEMYRARDFAKAGKVVDDCSALAGEKYSKLYEMYKTRMVDLQSAKLPKAWDGIINAESK